MCTLERPRVSRPPRGMLHVPYRYEHVPPTSPPRQGDATMLATDRRDVPDRHRRGRPVRTRDWPSPCAEEGIEDFVVLERAGDLGGTWRDNTYPGCACDIASVLYSYTDEQNPRLEPGVRAASRKSGTTCTSIAERHDVASHMRLTTMCSTPRGTTRPIGGRSTTSRGDYTAEILVSATGALADPSIPELPGLDRFAGTIFHSARWNHDHDLIGRRVAVVGTGASAIQFVPEIQPAAGHLDAVPAHPAVGAARGATRGSRGAGSDALPVIPGCCRSCPPGRCSRCTSRSTSASSTRRS